MRGRSRDVVDRATRHGYQDWPNHDAQIVYDGTDVWSTNWKLANPPKVMPYLTFNTITTPWLALLPDVEFVDTGIEKLPGDERESVSVVIKLPQDPAKPPVASYYKMYADPQTHRLRAVAYAVNYGALLDAMQVPAGVEEAGPMIHIFDDWTEASGLLVPTRYHTIGPTGSVYGQHTVENWAFDQPFDEQRMQRPADAVVDTSSHLRAPSEP